MKKKRILVCASSGSWHEPCWIMKKKFVHVGVINKFCKQLPNKKVCSSRLLDEKKIVCLKKKCVAKIIIKKISPLPFTNKNKTKNTNKKP